MEVLRGLEHQERRFVRREPQRGLTPLTPLRLREFKARQLVLRFERRPRARRLGPLTLAFLRCRRVALASWRGEPRMRLWGCWIGRWRSPEIPSESLGGSRCGCSRARCRARCGMPCRSPAASPASVAGSAGDGAIRDSRDESIARSQAGRGPGSHSPRDAAQRRCRRRQSARTSRST